MFFFRTEDSVKKAVSKITQSLWTINKKSSIVTDNEYILEIHNTKLEITYYKKDFKLYDKSNNFVISLNLMEEELTKEFTEIRKKYLASTLYLNKNSHNKEDMILSKGIPRTEISMTLSSISTSLEIPLKTTIEENSREKNRKVDHSLSKLVEGFFPKVSKISTSLESKSNTNIASPLTIKVEEVDSLLTSKAFTKDMPQEVNNIALPQGDASNQESEATSLTPKVSDIITPLTPKPPIKEISQGEVVNIPISSNEGSRITLPRLPKLNIPNLSIPKITLPKLGFTLPTWISKPKEIDVSNLPSLQDSAIITPDNNFKFTSLRDGALAAPNILKYIPNPMNYIPNFSFIGKVCLGLSKEIIKYPVILLYLITYIIILAITWINFGVITYLRGFPFLWDFIIHFDVNLAKLGDWTILENIPKTFKEMNLNWLNMDYITNTFKDLGFPSLDTPIREWPISEIFKNITENPSISEFIPEVIKNINLESFVPDIIPEMIKEAESLIGQGLPEVVKEVISNTVITLSENMSSDIEAPLETVVTEKKAIVDTEPLIKDEIETKDTEVIKTIQKVFYVVMAFVAIDFFTGFPSNVTLNDPQIMSYLGDFVGGLVSIGFLTISSLLQMLFGNSDKDNSPGPSSSTSDLSNNTERSGNNFGQDAIEYKNNSQSSLRESPGIKFIMDKADSIGKGIESKASHILGRGESSNNNSNSFLSGGTSSGSSKADLILGFMDSIPSLPSTSSISTTGGNIINGISSTGGSIVNGISNTGGSIVNGISTTGVNIAKDISNTGGIIIKDLSSTGGSIIKDISTTGGSIIKDLSSTGGSILKDVSDSLNTSINTGAHSPLSTKEDNSSSFLDKTKHFLSRDGDRTFTNEPNTGPLPTNLKDSMIPIITLNDSTKSIEFDPILEACYTNNEVEYTVNNLGEDIMQLSKTIENHSQSINLEDTKDIRGIIHQYGEQIRIQSEALNERDLQIQMNEDVLLFQEKELKYHKQFEREQEITILRQTGQLKEKDLEISVQEETIKYQIETIERQRDVVEELNDLRLQTSEQKEVIEKQREAVQKSLVALQTLANNIKYDNGNSLLSKEDVKLLIESITSDETTTEVIMPRDRHASEMLKPEGFVTRRIPTLNDNEFEDDLKLEDFVTRRVCTFNDNEFEDELSTTSSDNSSLSERVSKLYSDTLENTHLNQIKLNDINNLDPSNDKVHKLDDMEVLKSAFLNLSPNMSIKKI